MKAKKAKKPAPVISIGGGERIEAACYAIIQIMQCGAEDAVKIEALRTLAAIAPSQPTTITHCTFSNK